MAGVYMPAAEKLLYSSFLHTVTAVAVTATLARPDFSLTYSVGMV
jgi:hypothetical protein